MTLSKILVVLIVSLGVVDDVIGADGNIVLNVKDAGDVVSISKFSDGQNNTYFVAAAMDDTDRGDLPESSLRLVNYKTGKVISEVSIEQAPLIFPFGSQVGILALPQLAPDINWKIIQVDVMATTLQVEKDLPDYSFVTQVLQGVRGYYVLGLNLREEPVVSYFDDQFNVRAERVDESFAPGIFTGAFVLGDDIVALISSSNGSTLIRLTEGLKTISTTALDGLGANGVALQDGGYALTYVTVPDMMVILERFDAGHNRRWRVPLYKMSAEGVSSGVKLAKLQNGIAFAGFNNNQLLIGRISIDGKDMRLESVSEESLVFNPTSSNFFLFEDEESVHVWGLGMNSKTYVGSIFRADYLLRDE